VKFRPQLADILQPRNRGLLMDLVMFFIQILLFYILARQFRSVALKATAGELISKTSMALYCLALVTLSPVAAILKRRPTRLRDPNFDDKVSSLPGGLKKIATIFYFLSQFLFSIAACMLSVEILEDLSDRSYTDILFLPLFFLIPAIAIINTLVFVFYFRPIKHKAVISFLASPGSEFFGDALLFLNMILFQVFWGYLMTDLTHDYSGLASRVFMFAFTALIIYFPPRLLFLAEHAEDKRSWLFMLLANLPIILRLILAP
jgi:hypothetical protein